VSNLDPVDPTLTKGKACTKNILQAVNFKPVSLHEILSNRDKQGIIREQRRSATSLQMLVSDHKDETRERGAQQSMMG
jgi:hypothetical protein